MAAIDRIHTCQAWPFSHKLRVGTLYPCFEIGWDCCSANWATGNFRIRKRDETNQLYGCISNHTKSHPGWNCFCWWINGEVHFEFTLLIVPSTGAGVAHVGPGWPASTSVRSTPSSCSVCAHAGAHAASTAQRGLWLATWLYVCQPDWLSSEVTRQDQLRGWAWPGGTRRRMGVRTTTEELVNWIAFYDVVCERYQDSSVLLGPYECHVGEGISVAASNV